MEIIYHTDGKGRWWKKYTKEKCSNSIFVKYSCQREEGHEGNHWAYMESGAYVHTTPDGGCCILFPEKSRHAAASLNAAGVCGTGLTVMRSSSLGFDSQPLTTTEQK